MFYRVSAEGGECRSDPPACLAELRQGLAPGVVQLARHGYWAPVANDDWCGRHAPQFSSDPAGRL